MWFLLSNTRLPDWVVAISARMPHIVASLATERHTAQHIATKPAAYYTQTPLGPRALKSRPCLPFFRAVRALYHHWVSLAVNTGHTLVLFQLLCPQKLCELLLSRRLFVRTFVFEQLNLLIWHQFPGLKTGHTIAFAIVSSIVPEQLAWGIEGSYLRLDLWAI